MAEMIRATNENLDGIRSELVRSGDAVGYTLTDDMRTALAGQFSNYDKMFENVTSINGIMAGIYDTVAAMARASGAVKAYAKGGLIDYTGLAAVHGTPGNPEMVLSAADTARFLEAASLLRSGPAMRAIGSKGFAQSGFGGGLQINDLHISIPIDHVQDYNEMLSQMQKDPKFERLVGALSLDRVAGKSSLGKYGVRV